MGGEVCVPPAKSLSHGSTADHGIRGNGEVQQKAWGGVRCDRANGLQCFQVGWGNEYTKGVSAGPEPYLQVQLLLSAQPLQQYFLPSLGLVNPFPANAFQSFCGILHLGQVSSAMINPPFQVF